MEYSIISYKDAKEMQKSLLSYLSLCDWGAGRYLVKLLTEKNFFIEEDKILFLMDGQNVVSFLTLSHQDCISDETLYPWIGFVYTDKNYRGQRNSERLIRYALSIAQSSGHKKVYLATDNIGLYEKYGFVYWTNRLDINNEDSRVYVYDLV